MKSSFVNEKITLIQEKYDQSESNARKAIEDLESAQVQLVLLSRNVDEFVGQVSQHAASLLENQPDTSDAFNVVNGALGQLAKFISDQPTVLQFEVAKMQLVIELLQDFNVSCNDLKNQVNNRESRLDEIKEQIEAGNDPTKRKKAGKRVEKIRDVRIAQAELDSAQISTKKSKKKSSPKQSDKS